MSEINLAVTGEDYVSIKVTDFGRPILFDYHTLNGNNPNAKNNYLGIWPSENGKIPLGRTAEGSMLIESTKTVDFSQDFDYELEEGHQYVIGYCLAGDPTDEKKEAHRSVSATALIPAKNGRTAADVVYNTFKLSIRASGSTYLLDYCAINNMELKDKSWVGIWFESENIGSDIPQWTSPIKQQGTENYIKLGNIKAKHNYKLGFFYGEYDEKKLTGDACSKLTALLFFTTN
jgi:hypothetical protein